MPPPTDPVREILVNIIILIYSLIPIVLGIGMLVFIWGMIKYVIAKGAEDKKNANYVMVYSILAMFVMVSVWGIVFILINTVFPDGFARSPGIEILPVLPALPSK